MFVSLNYTLPHNQNDGWNDGAVSISPLHQS